MILQGFGESKAEQIAQALTEAEIARQELERTQTELDDADEALNELGVTVDG